MGKLGAGANAGADEGAGAYDAAVKSTLQGLFNSTQAYGNASGLTGVTNQAGLSYMSVIGPLVLILLTITF